MKENFVNKPLFKLQTKNNTKLFILFSAIASIMLFITIALFPVIQELSNEMPEVLKEMMYMGSIEQYFNLEALEMWILLISIFV